MLSYLTISFSKIVGKWLSLTIIFAKFFYFKNGLFKSPKQNFFEFFPFPAQYLCLLESNSQNRYCCRCPRKNFIHSLFTITSSYLLWLAPISLGLFELRLFSQGPRMSSILFCFPSVSLEASALAWSGVFFKLKYLISNFVF